MEQVINRIKNSIMDSVGYFDHYLNSKKRAGRYLIDDKHIQYDHDLAFDMLTRQHKMLKIFMELKHSVRAMNKSKTLRLLEKFCIQFTANLDSRNDVLYPLLQHTYADNEVYLERIQNVRRDYKAMVKAVKQFCDDCKTITKITPNNVGMLMQHLEEAISLFVEYSNDEEHFLHPLYNRIPTYVAGERNNTVSVDEIHIG